MKFGACICVYDDHEYLNLTILPLVKHLDKILFLVSTVPWNGQYKDNSSTVEHIKKLCKNNSKFELVQKKWTNEVDQRNYGLAKFYAEGIDYYFVIDADEIYHESHFLNIKNFIKSNLQLDAFHIEWNTYWTKDYYRIEPREHFKPLIAVKTSNFLFTFIRGGITSVTRTKTVITKHNGNYNGVIIPPQLAICYHLSYARDDESTKRKFETNSHASEFIPDWYEKVWKKWTPSMMNLHPVTPEQYQQAVKEDFSKFPTQLQTFIKKEKLSNRLCSIIILNWNSCDLLKRCLDLIKKNTKHPYELIIIDNGSIKDDSAKYIDNLQVKKIMNKENLGFAIGVNQGMKIAKGDILLMNVDAEPQEGWLEEMYKTMMKFPDAGIIGPLGNEVASGHQREGYIKEDSKTPNVYGYCMLILRELFEKIGYFDENYKVGGYEDNDYGIRAKLAGYELYLSAKALVKHEAHQVFKKNGLNNFEYEARNREYYLNKFFGIMLDHAKLHNMFEIENFVKLTGIKIK